MHLYNYGIDLNYLYHFVEAARLQMSPLQQALLATQELYRSPLNPISNTQLARTISASAEIAERIVRVYKKPSFNINHTSINVSVWGRWSC